MSDMDILSFAEEIENDKKLSAEFLSRKEPKLQNAISIYKRVLYLIGSGNMKLTDNQGLSKNASDNELPVSSYMNHGFSILIEIPKGSKNKLINWISSGKKNKKKVRYITKGQQDSHFKNSTILYERVATPDDVYLKKKTSKDGFDTLRKRGFFLGLRTSIINSLNLTKTKYFGLDLALNYGLANKKSIADGRHGHLYIQYVAPEKDSIGAMLIGIEYASPNFQGDSKIDGTEQDRASNYLAIDSLVNKQELSGEDEYEYTIIPKKYGGISIRLDIDELNYIMNSAVRGSGKKLATLIPSVSAKDFDSASVHITPTFRHSKNLKFKKKPNFLKNTLNKLSKKVSFGMIKPYQKDFNEYQKFVSQEKISSLDGARISNQIKKYKQLTQQI